MITSKKAGPSQKFTEILIFKNFVVTRFCCTLTYVTCLIFDILIVEKEFVMKNMAGLLEKVEIKQTQPS